MSGEKWYGHRCDICGKFRRPGELVEYESRDLDINGNLLESWWLECDSCRQKEGHHA